MGKNRKCAAEENDGEPSQNMVTINKYVLFYNFQIGDVHSNNIQADICYQEKN